jgi:hypothetical protein
LVVVLPDLFVVLPDLLDFCLQLVHPRLLLLFPGLVLLISALLLLVLLGLLCTDHLHHPNHTPFKPSMRSFFLSSSSLSLLNSASMGSFSFFTFSISSSSWSFRYSHCYSLNSMFPELSAYLILRFSRVISLLSSFSSFLLMSAVSSLCYSLSSFSEKFSRLPLSADRYSFSFSF